MPYYGKKSKKQLLTCHQDLQRLFNAVIKEYDCSILQGERGEASQNAAYNAGKSKLKFPKSKHNKKPSGAVDVAPYPIDWSDTRRFYAFGGFVLGMAAAMGIRIRWGGDWDMDTQVKDQSFNDLLHFEIIE